MALRSFLKEFRNDLEVNCLEALTVMPRVISSQALHPNALKVQRLSRKGVRFKRIGSASHPTVTFNWDEDIVHPFRKREDKV